VERTHEGKIIVVDDEAMILETTASFLEQSGFEPVACASAEAALAVFSQGPVDAVLTDIKMPGLSGIDLLERIRGLDPQIPVILLTGNADVDTAVSAVKKGAFDFLLKPYGMKQLVGAVDRAVQYRHALQKEARYRQLLEEMNLQIESLISERSMNLMALTVADRVRNPATVIGLTCRQMLGGGPLPDEVRDGIEVISAEAAKLEAIVADFRRALKERESLFVYADLNEIVRDVAALVEADAAARKVAFTTALVDRPLLMNMEKNLVKLAVMNVARNAIEATPEGGTVRLTSRASGELAIVEAADTGHGIATEDLSRIFEPFYTTRSHRFGMGLPLVRQIVREHLGEIDVESAPGRGTTVRMSFPVRWRDPGLRGAPAA
jgi:signal transduction histidine kinase